MSNEFWQFDRYIDGLMSVLSPVQRRVFFSRLSKELTRINAQRIRQNITPDGDAFEPRKPQTQLRAKRGRTRAMFQKMPKSIRQTSSPDGLSLSFSGSAAQIADVHHYGQEDYVLRNRPRLRIRYPERQLLGISDSDQKLIIDKLIEQIQGIA